MRGEKISCIANMYTNLHQLKLTKAELKQEVTQLLSKVEELQVSARTREDALLRAKQERDSQRAAAEQKAKEAEELGTALQALIAVEEELQQERATLGEVRSQLALKDSALTEVQTQLQQDRVALEKARS